MNTPNDKALLPAGLEDVLPPYAAREAAVVERLIASFAAHGYQRVKPPLLEFEEALLAGAGAALTQQTFRLMDPVSQRMMGLRADITPQVARIAATRLRNAARPLRLCYGGQILRVKGSQLRSERQFGQVGVELIGAGQEDADAEVVLLAAEALNAVDVAHLSIDLNLPPLVGNLCGGIGLEAEQSAALRQALDRKDIAAVAQIAGDRAPLFTALLRATGPADTALAALGKLSLPKAAKADIARLRRVVGLIRGAAPELTLTIDPVENRGFEYQTGISFIIFARDVRGELGRGGRYTTNSPEGGCESSTGFTLYMDTVQRTLPEPETPSMLYIPAGSAPVDRGRAWREDGWVTLAGLDEEADVPAAARRLGCSHAWIDGRIVELKG
ncbi:MAG: ATP phosphoribosyltransferase regulatory subunit [Alphaproteobacteria bacterium]